MARYLWGFMIVAVALELLEVMSIAYKQTEEWEVLGMLIREKLFVSYVVLQYLVFSLIPFFLLGVNALFKLRDGVAKVVIGTAATMLLVQVLLMRWNVVVGGQMVSKSMRGFTSYFPGLWEKEGLAVAIVIFTLPFGILCIFNKIVPLFPDAEKRAG